jgi:diketogulonate reductase-like aldo/keto reductase
MNTNELLIRTGNLSKITAVNTQEEYDNAIQKAIEKKNVWIVPEAKIMNNGTDVTRNLANEDVVTVKIFLSEIAHRDHLRQAVYKTLEDLGMHHLDLLLLHVEHITNENLQRFWHEAEELYQANVVTKIGVCDFNASQLEMLLSFATVTPHANQIRYTGFREVVDRDLLELTNKHNIRLLSGPPAEVTVLQSETKNVIQEKLSISAVNYVWAARYTIVSCQTALVLDTGYIIKLQDHSSPIAM